MRMITYIRILLSVFVLCPLLATGQISNDNRNYHHLIMYGQSLSTGHESDVTLSAENIPGNYMLGNQVWINYGNNSKTTINPLIGSVAAGTADIVECPLLGMANHIQLKLQEEGMERDILATSAGTSGKCIEDLSKNSSSGLYRSTFTETLTSAARACQFSRSTISCPAIIFMQGEWNYQQYDTAEGVPATGDKDEYKELMLKLKEDMENDIADTYGQSGKPLFYTYQVGAQYSKENLSIGMAQIEASNENDDIICAGPVYQMTDVGGHLDANGYRWYGELLGKVYYKTKILKEAFAPLQPIEVSRDEEDYRNIIVRFWVPVPPLVLDDKTLPNAGDYGFEIRNNNTKQTIQGMRISGDSIIFSFEKELFGKIDVIYAGVNTTPRGHGNLRDSDDYPAFFNYTDLDEKDENGEYILPRRENKSLRPANEPLDDNGNVIYDQPYPLYNFCLAFYYTLPIGVKKLEVGNFPPVPPPSTGISNVGSSKPMKIFYLENELVITSPETEYTKIEIYSISGKKCTDLGKQWIEGEITIPVSSLSKGVYLVKATGSKQTVSSKIVVY